MYEILLPTINHPYKGASLNMNLYCSACK